MKKASNRNCVLLLAPVMLVLSLLISICIGSADISIKQTLMHMFYNDLSINREIIFNIRLPRALMAGLAGGGLAVCGAVMQAVVRNPLANPYLMGVSWGAALGATFYLMLLTGTGGIGLAASAFTGALLSCMLVFGVAVAYSSSPLRLLLSGLAVNILFSSITNLLIYLNSDSQQLQTIIFWMMGSLVPAGWDIFPIPALVIICVSIYFATQWKNLNLIMLGDNEACSLGINPVKHRLIYLGAAAFITSVTVAYFGVIGFVGIVVPHIVRFFTGSGHRLLIPYSFTAGAVFLIWADIIARSVTATEIPIGIITGLAGAPVFFWILLRPEKHSTGN